MRVNREINNAEEKETDLDHDEKSADRSKYGLGRGDTRYILCDIQGIDGHIQHGDDIIPAFRGSGFCVHGRKSEWPREMVYRERGVESWAG